MKELVEMVTEKSFFLFVLGSFGLPFFKMVRRIILKCNPNVFSCICVILAYFVITYFTT